jgi:streptomycin 6-kinase
MFPGVTHPGLAWLEASEEGRAWLRRLPDLVEDCARDWGLGLGEPFEYAFASFALRAARGSEPVVLKIAFPGRESEHEAEALRLWDGEGAVRLLEHDAERNALLLERCEPGTRLADVGPERALDVMVDLLPRLWRPAGPPFRSLEVEAAWWAHYLPSHWERTGRPFERRLLDEALGFLAELPGSQGDQVLVNQDLHADNVLRATREPWLVIDPKPLVGEREFSLAPIVRGHELRHDAPSVRRRLDRLTVELGLDRERARGWALAQTLAWGFDDEGAIGSHLDVVRWLSAAA